MIREYTKTPLLLLTAGCFVLVIGHQRQVARIHENTNQGTGRLGGAVMDANEAAIVTPRPTLIIRDLHRKSITKIMTGENGGYETQLASGIYEISSDLPGFYPFRRAAFRIQAGSDALLNLVPSLRYFVRGTSVSTKHVIDKPAPRPRYESFPIPESPSGFLDMVIQFERKRSARGVIKYDNAVLSYDLLTVYASRLWLDRRTLLVKASGNRVIVEDGKRRLRIQSAEIHFEDGEPVLRVSR